VQAARDLSAGSQELDTKLDDTGAAGFGNDAPRR
jgi:hypothetical protein